MTTQRELHGITFIDCPECEIHMGQRGMASHRKAAHGVTPAAKGNRKPQPLTTGRASALRFLIANATATAADVMAGQSALDALVKAEFATKSDDTYVVTAAGIARLS